LNEILVTSYSQPCPANTAHNPHRYRLANRKRIADGQHHVSDFKMITVRNRDHWQIIFRFDLQHSDIRRRIRSNHFCIELPFARCQSNLHLVCTFNHVAGRQNVTIRGDDDSRSQTLGFAVSRLQWLGLVSKKSPEKRIFQQCISPTPFMDRHARRDIHDTRRNLFNYRREAGSRLYIPAQRRFLNCHSRRRIRFSRSNTWLH
jgi:hypothetical protein